MIKDIIITQSEFVEYHLTDAERDVIVSAFKIINREKKRLNL